MEFNHNFTDILCVSYVKFKNNVELIIIYTNDFKLRYNIVFIKINISKALSSTHFHYTHNTNLGTV